MDFDSVRIEREQYLSNRNILKASNWVCFIVFFVFHQTLFSSGNNLCNLNLNKRGWGTHAGSVTIYLTENYCVGVWMVDNEGDGNESILCLGNSRRFKSVSSPSFPFVYWTKHRYIGWKRRVQAESPFSNMSMVYGNVIWLCSTLVAPTDVSTIIIIFFKSI